MRKNIKGNNIALYLRSNNNQIDSNSIINQKYNILNNYNFTNKNIFYYVDDSYSGRDCERPSLKKLINDIENKKIDTVISNSISRMGRNIDSIIIMNELHKKYNTFFYFDNNEMNYDILEIILSVKERL